MESKLCPYCNLEKPKNLFYKCKRNANGVRTYCIDCEKIKANLRKDYFNERAKSKYKNDLNFRKKVLYRTKKYIKDNPEKNRAQTQVRYRVAKGIIKRLPCEECGFEPAHAHHEDYSKPLDVIWLCPEHHKQIHSRK